MRLAMWTDTRSVRRREGFQVLTSDPLFRHPEALCRWCTAAKPRASRRPATSLERKAVSYARRTSR